MRQIFLDRGNACIKNVPYPKIEPYTVLVAVHYSVVGSGQECEALLKGNTAYFEMIPYKVKQALSCVISQNLEDTALNIKAQRSQQYNSIGSSCTGRVVAIGDHVKEFRVGDWVACFGREYAHYADVISVNHHSLIRLSKKELLKIGALTGYGARAMHMIHKAEVSIGEIVAVVIYDLLGLLVAHLCIKSGMQVIGICSSIDMMHHAQRYGLQHVFAMQDSGLIYSIELITGNNGVDALFLPSLSFQKLLFDPAYIVRKKGSIIVGSESNILHNSSIVLHKEINIMFVSTYGAEADEDPCKRAVDYPIAHVRWTEQRNARAFVRLITEGILNTSEYDFPEVDIEEIVHKKNVKIAKPLIGFYLRYGSTEKNNSEIAVTPAVRDTSVIDCFKEVPLFIPARKTVLNTAIIGAPKIKDPLFFSDLLKLRHTRVVAVSDEDTVDALNLAQKCGADNIYNSIDDVIQNEVIDVAMISSKYNTRSINTLKALQAGKAVYVERPFVINQDDFLILDTFFARNQNLPLCVDDYRLHSPLITRIKEVICGRKAPMIINYRMNVGGISKEELIQVDRNAGRIINDASHILHLFCSLVNAEPKSVSVEALHGVSYNLFPTENFIVAVTFSDGSVCNFVYTTLGSTDMGSERMEIFVDKKSIILDDYIGLYGFGTPSWFNMTLEQSDKGHQILLKTFFKDLKNGTNNSFVSWNDIERSMRLTLLVDKLACQGGGSQGVEGLTAT